MPLIITLKSDFDIIIFNIKHNNFTKDDFEQTNYIGKKIRQQNLDTKYSSILMWLASTSTPHNQATILDILKSLNLNEDKAMIQNEFTITNQNGYSLFSFIFDYSQQSDSYIKFINAVFQEVQHLYTSEDLPDLTFTQQEQDLFYDKNLSTRCPEIVALMTKKRVRKPKIIPNGTITTSPRKYKSQKKI